MNNVINLAEGIDLLGVDLDGTNQFLNTPHAQGPGMALLVSGDLTPGNANVLIVQGDPIREAIVSKADGSLRLAAIVRMAPTFDHRHSAYLQRRLVREISEVRGLKPKDENTASEIEINEVPFGDLELMRTAGDRLVAEIDGAIGFEIFGRSPSAGASKG